MSIDRITPLNFHSKLIRCLPYASFNPKSGRDTRPSLAETCQDRVSLRSRLLSDSRQTSFDNMPNVSKDLHRILNGEFGGSAAGRRETHHTSPSRTPASMCAARERRTSGLTAAPGIPRPERSSPAHTAAGCVPRIATQRRMDAVRSGNPAICRNYQFLPTTFPAAIRI
jgi:hypothetical protein